MSTPREHYMDWLGKVQRNEIEPMRSEVSDIAGDLLTSITVIDELQKRIERLMLYGNEQVPPRARSTDPDTSQEAARNIRLTMTVKRMAVLEAVRLAGPITDLGLADYYRAQRVAKGWPEQSDSGLRTRRSELVDLGKVQRVGDRKERGARRALWSAVGAFA
jgi:hypothetical protein